MGAVHYGTSSWSEKGWVGTFYPKGTPPRDFLSYYSTQFDTVEADNTYYAVPALDLVRGWERKVPAGFQLAAKFPRSIVHAGAGPRPDGSKVLVGDEALRACDDFLDAMGEMGGKCGPLVLQFPYFARDAFPSVEPFLARLERFLEGLPAGFRYAVEVRNKSWLAEPLLEVLRRRRIPLVLVDLSYMPHPDRLAQRFDLFTGDFVYARLIGDRKATDARTTTFSEIVLDQSERLARWAEFLRPVVEGEREILVYANNHYAGHGPATIRDLAARIAAASDSAEGQQ